YVYAVPRVNAGTTLLRCDDAGVYDVTANLTARGVTRVLSTAINTSSTFSWSANVSDSIIVPNVSKRYTFNPNKAGVVYSPAPNIITYRYSLTSNYLITNPMTCANSDTVQFFVVSTPVIDAGSQIRICKNEPLLNLTT